MTRSGEEPQAAHRSGQASPAVTSGLVSSPEPLFVDATYLGWSMRIRRDSVTVYSRNGVLHAILNTVPQARAFIRGTRFSGIVGAENARLALDETEVCAVTAAPSPPVLGLVERAPVAGSPEGPQPRAPGRARSRRHISQQGA